MSTASAVLLFLAASCAIGWVQVLRMPKGWDPPHTPFDPFYLLRRSVLVVAAPLLAAGLFAAFLASLTPAN